MRTAVGSSMWLVAIPSSIARWSVATASLCVLTIGGTPSGHDFIVPGALVSARASAQERQAPALECIQEALGGARAFARVSSLHIVGETRPAVSSWRRALPGTREIRIVFPDKYERTDVGRVPGVAGATLKSTIGFNRNLILSAPRLPDSAQAMRSARLDFARQMWGRFPWQSAGVTVRQRRTRERNDERTALDLTNLDGFKATLLADAASCVPVALEYPTSTQPHSTTTRVDLSEYREFGGVRFPTVLATSTDGQLWQVERVSHVDVNGPDPRRHFASGR